MKKNLNYLFIGCLLSFQLYALNVGDIRVYSHLNEPFRAEMPLLEMGDIPLEEINAEIGNEEVFSRYGLSKESILSSIHLQVKYNEKGVPVVLMTSTKRIVSPYLEVILEVTWPDGGVLDREFTVLLDPADKVMKKKDLSSAPAVSPAAIQQTWFTNPEDAKRSKAAIEPRTFPALISWIPSIASLQETQALMFRMEHLEKRHAVLKSAFQQKVKENQSLREQFAGLTDQLPRRVVRAVALPVSPSSHQRMWLMLLGGLGAAIVAFGVWRSFRVKRVKQVKQPPLQTKPMPLPVEPLPQINPLPVADVVKSLEALETLLQLSKTYISRGDIQGARRGLSEVILFGTQTQKDEAMLLLTQLDEVTEAM